MASDLRRRRYAPDDYARERGWKMQSVPPRSYPSMQFVLCCWLRRPSQWNRRRSLSAYEKTCLEEHLSCKLKLSRRVSGADSPEG
jgi:hypothetical protein